MQAMSLVVTDGDGEQNEMRMLQDKLGATMKVVNTLTTQLTELKEQVRERTTSIVSTSLQPVRINNAVQGVKSPNVLFGPVDDRAEEEEAEDGICGRPGRSECCTAP